MRLYDELLPLYLLLTPREDYVEEAAVFQRLLRRELGEGSRDLLELGCGPGHLASWLEGFTLTLTDLSEAMLGAAARNNPGARCVRGDLRSVRLEQRFDVVFAHDALCYLRTPEDLRAAAETAFTHLRPGGLTLWVPDLMVENFEPGVETGVGRGEGETLLFTCEHWQPAGQQDGYVTDYILAHRVGEAPPTLHHERHEEGLFTAQAWLDALRGAGFEAWAEESPGDTAPILFWGRK